MSTTSTYWHPFADMAEVAGRELVIVRGEGVHVYQGTHGFGTSLSGMETVRQGLGPLTGSVSVVEYDSPLALEEEILRVGPERVAAFFCEPVIGAGGVRPAPPGYIEAVADV